MIASAEAHVICSFMVEIRLKNCVLTMQVEQANWKEENREVDPNCD